MHVTYLRCKSYHGSKVRARYLRVLRDRPAENYRPVSSCSIQCRDPPNPTQNRGRFVGGGGSSSWLGLRGGEQVSRLLLRVDFVRSTYIREFKAWFIVTTERGTPKREETGQRATRQEYGDVIYRYWVYFGLSNTKMHVRVMRWCHENIEIVLYYVDTKRSSSRGMQSNPLTWMYI